MRSLVFMGMSMLMKTFMLPSPHAVVNTFFFHPMHLNRYMKPGDIDNGFGAGYYASMINHIGVEK